MSLEVTGQLAIAGDAVSLNTTNYATVTVAVEGSFSGGIEVIGIPAAATRTVELPLSLVDVETGPLGTGTIFGFGSMFKRYFKAQAAYGDTIVRARDDFSGSVMVTVGASKENSVVLISGPQSSPLEFAQRAGRGFSVGTGTHQVQAGEHLNYVFSNPADSGIEAHVVIRRFACDTPSGDTPLEFSLVVNPAAITGGTLVAANNLVTGGRSSAIQFTYEVAAQNLNNRVIGSFYKTGGDSALVTTKRIVRPGESFGYTSEGAGTALSPQKVANNVIWYEEPVR